MRVPSSTSETMPVSGGTRSESGRESQANTPAMRCSPGASSTLGSPSCAITTSFLPSSVTSSGQRSASPGSGTHARASRCQRCSNLPPLSVNVSDSAVGQAQCPAPSEPCMVGQSASGLLASTHAVHGRRGSGACFGSRRCACASKASSNSTLTISDIAIDPQSRLMVTSVSVPTPKRRAPSGPLTRREMS